VVAREDRPVSDPGAAPLVRIEGVTKRFGDVTAVNAVSLDIVKGELFAILGSSGCGKTTLLRMLAGFEQPTEGRILIDGADMTDVPPYERPVNLMFQSYALFPHMTVEQNVAYGLKKEGLPAPQIRERVAEMLALVRLGPLQARKPDKLSGGEKQRVALARSLVKRPKLLLLDEPLAALDKKLREHTQFELANIQYQLGTTFVVVTHDQDEAMTLASRIAVMHDGRIAQIGTPGEVYEFPANRYVAGFVGNINLIEGRVTGAANGRLTLRSDALDAELAVLCEDASGLDGSVAVAVRPEKITISREAPNGAERNVVKGIVRDLGYFGDQSLYRVRTKSGAIVQVSAQNLRRSAKLSVEWDDEVFLSWEVGSTILLRT
jgi:putrescine transport system ATP-binding protein